MLPHTLPASTVGGAPDLAGLVTRFRREAAARLRAAGEAGLRAPPGALELEVRLRDVGAGAFAGAFRALEARGGPCAVSQTVSVTYPAERKGARRLREIRFAAGARAGEALLEKVPLIPAPLRVPAGPGGAPAYGVALSAEVPAPPGAPPPVADERVLIRVKARASFPVELPGAGGPVAWRVDLTAVRQLTGAEAAAGLKAAVRELFPPGVEADAAGFLGRLGLAGPGAGAPALAFEVEAELACAPEAADALRPADVTAAADFLRGLAAPGHAAEAALQARVFRLARHLVSAPALLERFRAEFGLKRLLPQAVALARPEYRALYPPEGFFLTDKADGRRGVAFVDDGAAFLLSDRLYSFPAPADSPAARAAASGLTVLDGELVGEGEGPPTFYAFDVFAVGGEELGGEPFEARVGHLGAGVGLLRALGVPAEAKPYVRLGRGPGELERAFRAVREAPRPYAVDGLILVEPGKPYASTAAYKWKSARDSTIDFLLRRPPPGAAPPGTAGPGEALYFLFVGARPEVADALGLGRCPGYAALFPGAGGAGRAGRAGAGGAGHASYAPIQFSPADAPLAYLFAAPADLGDLDGRVAELRFGGFLAPGRPAWELVRVRADRAADVARGTYFGNDLRTAELTWLNALDPLLLEELWAGPGGAPPARAPGGPYSAQAGVLRFLSARRIRASLSHAQWVVDLGAGRGGDLSAYLEAGVGRLVAVDRDRGALGELVRRRYALAAPGAGPRRRGPATAVYALAADAGAPAAGTAAALGGLGLPAGGGDALVCNLAAHDFFDSAAAVQNFAALARAVVRVGGLVVVTDLDGEAAHALLRDLPPGGAWEVADEAADAAAAGGAKYAVRRLFESDRLELAGQRIAVRVSGGPFREEFLVNFRALSAALRLRGFELLERASASALVPDFAARDRAAGRRLTAADRSYLGLFCEAVFARKE